MKTFIAYRHTGEKTAFLEQVLTTVQQAFARRGIEAYCTFFDKALLENTSLGARDIMDHAFSVIDTADFLFAIQASEYKSEGMLMEVGYCIAKDIPIVVATKQGIDSTYLPEMGSRGFAWHDMQTLAEGIRSLTLPVSVSEQ